MAISFRDIQCNTNNFCDSSFGNCESNESRNLSDKTGSFSSMDAANSMLCAQEYFSLHLLHSVSFDYFLFLLKNLPLPYSILKISY